MFPKFSKIQKKTNPEIQIPVEQPDDTSRTPGGVKIVYRDFRSDNGEEIRRRDALNEVYRKVPKPLH